MTSQADKPDTPVDESFLQRWSRRKHEVHNTANTDEQITTDAVPRVDTLPTDADMPPLESLTLDSDYRGFLSPRVSETLRRQALRKLFHSPVFNVRDGLDDYDEEFTAFAELGDIVTADMRHQLEMEAQRLNDLADADRQDQATDSEHQLAETDQNSTPGVADNDQENAS